MQTRYYCFVEQNAISKVKTFRQCIYSKIELFHMATAKLILIRTKVKIMSNKHLKSEWILKRFILKFEQTLQIDAIPR